MTTVREKLKNLGIPEKDLARAMILIRELRIKAIKMNLDPRATRIALIYGNLADHYFAQRRLGPEDLATLEEIAKGLLTYAKTKQPL